jgi:hypothetical protein
MSQTPVVIEGQLLTGMVKLCRFCTIGRESVAEGLITPREFFDLLNGLDLFANNSEDLYRAFPGKFG